MKLQLRHHTKAESPIRAILVKGNACEYWLSVAEQLGYNLADCQFYPIPDQTPNSLWGGLIVLPTTIEATQAVPHSVCQLVAKQLFIPEFSQLWPKLADEELHKLLGCAQYCLLPQIGLVKLEKAIDWTTILKIPKEHIAASTRPADSIYQPSNIEHFEVKTVEAEDIIELLEGIVEQPSEGEDHPLSGLEKIRLQLYRNLFKKIYDEDDHSSKKTTLMKGLESLSRFFSKDKGNWGTKWMKDFEQLDKRNTKTLEHLLEMFKTNPEEALKYALPLDDKESNRGGEARDNWELSKRWEDFSLFGKGSRRHAAGRHNIQQEAFLKLQLQYIKTAKNLKQKGDYKKAAFVYMKLLKDYRTAASVLDEGHYYKEAAAIYLKYIKDKKKAAETYVKASMISKAIELYLELESFEKAGDLYMRLHKTQDAMEKYQLVVQEHLQRKQYLKASFVYERKMDDVKSAQAIRLEGWKKNIDPFNCLNNYFQAYKNDEQFLKEMQRIYLQDTSSSQIEFFLQILKIEYNKRINVRSTIQYFAFCVVANHANAQKNLVQQLQYFNPKDKHLQKDVWRFKHSK